MRKLFGFLFLFLVIPAWLVFAQSASATPVNIPLTDFVIFSNRDLSIGGHSLVYGNMGSNNNVDGQGNSQFSGSIYVGGNFTPGSNVAIGSNGILPGPDVSQPGPQPLIYPAQLVSVVVNLTADFGGAANAALASRVFGNVYSDDVSLKTNVGIQKVGGLGGNLEYTGMFNRNTGAYVQGLVNGVAWGPAITGSNPSAPAALPSTTTFGTITMPTPTTFSAGGPNKSDPGTLLPGTYGTLTLTQNQTLNLSSGNYYFDAITAGGHLTIKIDLSSGNPINIYIVGNTTFGQDTVIKVKGANTGGDFMLLSDVPALAWLINWESKGKFDVGGGNASAWTAVFGGFLYSTYNSTGDGITIGQHVDWYGGLYSVDTMHLADHSRFNYVPHASVPEPATVLLLGVGLVGWACWRRKLSS